MTFVLYSFIVLAVNSDELIVYDYFKRLCTCHNFSLKRGINKITYGMNALLLYFAFNECKQVEYLKAEKALGVSSARMVKIIDGLLDKEYIIKTKSKEDKRKMILSLTDKGNDEKERLLKRALKISKMIFDEVGHENIETFIDLFIKINEATKFALENMKGEEDA